MLYTSSKVFLNVSLFTFHTFMQSIMENLFYFKNLYGIPHLPKENKENYLYQYLVMGIQ